MNEETRGTAQVLAEKATSYAQSVQPLLEQRHAATEPAEIVPTTLPAADPNPRANEPHAVLAETRPARPAGRSPEPGAQLASIEGAIPAIAPTPAVTDSLERRLAQRVKDDPQDVPAQMDYQLFELVKGENVPQLPALAGLNNEDRELVAAIVDGLSNFRSAIRADGNLLLSKKVRPMLDLGERLRSQAELTIPVIALCRKVDGFGVYEPIDPARFVAGRDQQAIVYCEVENFASQLDDQKRWQTRLAEEVVLYDEQNGLEVWRDKQARPIVDLSRNRRHDFFFVKLIRLPANLTIGRYLLKVTVVDQQVQRVAENTVSIEMVAQ